MTDHEIVLEIQAMLDGVEWNSDTLSQVADLLIGNGYRVRDLEDVDYPASSTQLRS